MFRIRTIPLSRPLAILLGVLIFSSVVLAPAAPQSGGGVYVPADHTPAPPPNANNQGALGGANSEPRYDDDPQPPPPPNDQIKPIKPFTLDRPTGSTGGPLPQPMNQGTGGMRRVRRPATMNFTNWEIWWERNKFSIFKLRKIYDRPFTGAGGNPSPGEESEEARLEKIDRFKFDELIPALVGMLDHRHQDIRSAAAISLGKLHAEQALPGLKKLIQDESYVVRVSALFALGLMEEARATYLLLNLAHNSPFGQKVIGRSPVMDSDRGFAALAMALRKANITSMGLSQFLEHWNKMEPDLLVLMIEASGIEGNSNMIPILNTILNNKKLPEVVRATAATSLGKIGDPISVPILLAGLEDKALNIRRSSAIALGSLVSQGNSDAIKKMIHLIDTEKDIPLRNFLAISLGNIGGKRAKDALKKALQTGPSTLRPWASLGLGLACRVTQEDEIVKILMSQLDKEKNAERRGAVIISLGIMGLEDASQKLVQIATTEKNPSLQGYALLALGMIGLGENLDVIKNQLTTSPDPSVIRNAALGLGVLGDSRSGQVLIDLIRNSNNPYVQSSAAVSVGFLGHFQMADKLLEIATEPDRNPISVAYAVNALGLLFDRDRMPALCRIAQDSNYLAGADSLDWVLSIGI